MEKQNMTQTLKSIYAFFAGIVTVIVTFFLIKNKTTKKKIDKSDKKIADNKSAADNAQGRIDQIEDQKQDVKTDIETREDVIETLKDKAEEVKPEEVSDIAEAKENIVKKTKRRGRKPKAKKS